MLKFQFLTSKHLSKKSLNFIHCTYYLGRCLRNNQIYMILFQFVECCNLYLYVFYWTFCFSDRNVFRAMGEVTTVADTLSNLRENINSCSGELYTEEERLADSVGIEPTVPRLCGRQTKRTNPWRVLQTLPCKTLHGPPESTDEWPVLRNYGSSSVATSRRVSEFWDFVVLQGRPSISSYVKQGGGDMEEEVDRS